jgi:thymidylate kinase
MIVSFMGNDGGGKTTTIRFLQNCSQLQNRKWIHVPGFEHVFIDGLKSVYGRLACRSRESLQAEYASAERRKLFRFWPYLVFLDCCALLVKYSLRREIVFLDRHPYDYLASFEELGISSPWVRRLFLLSPKPRHLFLLDASPEVARARKKVDHTDDIGYYTRQRSRYLELAQRKDIPIINTDTTPVSEVASVVLRQLGLATL